MSMTARRWLVVVVVAAVGISVLAVGWVAMAPGDGRATAGAGDLEDFCMGIGGDGRGDADLLEGLGPGGPTSTYPDREAVIATLQLLYSRRWLAGAPDELRATAQELHQGVGRLSSVAPDDAEVARLVRLVDQVRDGSREFCW